METGAIGTLLSQLNKLSVEDKLSLLYVRGEIMSLVEKLEAMQSALFRESEDHADAQAKLWATEARVLTVKIESVVERYLAALQSWETAGGDLKGFIDNINIKRTSAKARRKFTSEIRDANRRISELAERRGRYRLDLVVPPMHPDPAPAPAAVDDSWDGVEVELPKDDDMCRLPSRVQDDVAFMRTELQSVNVALRMLAEVPAGELDLVTKAWADELREAYSDIRLVVDAFNSSMASRKARRRFATDIRDLKCYLLEVAERRRRYDLHQLRAPMLTSDNARSDTTAGTAQDPKSLVAIDGPRDDLVKILTGETGSSSKSNRQLFLASIVGIAGVGKTTLAKEVYRILKEQFDCVAWVSLPTLPDMKMVLTDLLNQLNQKQDGQHSAPQAVERQHSALQAVQGPLLAMDEKSLIDKIRHTLTGKRYFVVLDYIWDLTAWNIMKHAWMENSNGSAVLATTRSVDIAGHVDHVYRLEPLSETHSREVFYERLSSSKHKCPPELAEKSQKFIEKCGGIPLVIIDTARLLASKPWAVHDSVDYELEKYPNVMENLLSLSYNDLPRHLKPCFSYLSMFQKGHEIRGEHLVWGWIAEGFIPETDGETLQQVGESYLNELIKRKLIEAVEVDAGGKVMSCRVYSLVQDLIISKPNDENSVTISDSPLDNPLPDIVHRLSIQGNKHPLPPVRLSDVRSLVVSGDANLMPSLSGFRELRALDLGVCDSLQNDHLKGIENSFLLKYLVIGGNCITAIPKEIVNLKLLRTLDLRPSGLKELPESVVLLKRLERLCVNGRMKIPFGIGKMEALQELGDISVSKPMLLKEICKLTKLKVLRIAIWSWDEVYDEEMLHYLRSLVRQQNIQSLSILTCCSLHFMYKLEAEWAPPSLQKLEIRYSAFFTLPGWILSLQNLSSLSIEVHKLSQGIINMLGELLALCSLSLTSKHAPEGRFGIGTDGFRNLTGFHFASNAMGKIFEPETKAMQMLKRIKLSFQASQTEDVNQGFNFGLEELCSLEHVHVEIVCFDATLPVVESAEDAIREAILRGRSLHPNLEIRRVREKDMIKNEDEKKTRGEEQEQEQEQEEEEKKKTKNKKKRKIRVTAKKFRQKEKGVTRKFKIVSLHLKSHILTLQAL